MRLADLAPEALGTANPAIEVVGITADSRSVQPGWLFAALPGTQVDGRRFIPSALENGAVAILAISGTRDSVALPQGVSLVEAENPRLELARMAARFHGQQPATIAAVTGTNGKTSVAVFARQLWEALGQKAASLGTLGASAPELADLPPLTTPDPVALHAALARLAAAGYDHLAFEASSHGLDQYRLDGVRVRAAAFTNLSRDHLDYHGDMASYFAAKRRLFSDLLPDDGVAVLNQDTPEFAGLNELMCKRGIPVISFGTRAEKPGAPPDIYLEDAHSVPEGWSVRLRAMGQTWSGTVPLPGGFQLSNAMAAAGLVIGCGAPADQVLAALSCLRSAPGRMELVARHPNGAGIYVDFAHTPDALETALQALRTHCPGRLVALFGAGGDRDPGKRPLMGAAAARHADAIIVTDDNPRTEDPAAIRAAVLSACPGACDIGDRRRAITHAIADLGPGDLLVVAGKGHEQGQTVGDEVLPFDDATVCREAVESLTECPA